MVAEPQQDVIDQQLVSSMYTYRHVERIAWHNLGRSPEAVPLAEVIELLTVIVQARQAQDRLLGLHQYPSEPAELARIVAAVSRQEQEEGFS